MAQLTGPPDRVLELTILDYEYRAGQVRWEDDWLVTHMKVTIGTFQWSRTAAALLTTEVRDLILWLCRVADGVPGIGGWRRPVEVPLNMGSYKAIEPNLCFKAEVDEDEMQVLAGFGHKFHPGYQRGGPALEPFTVPFQPTPDGLRTFADGLEQNLFAFPIRSERK